MNAPDKLSPQAKVYWYRMVDAIEVTEANCELVAMMCDCLATYWEAKAIQRQSESLFTTNATGLGLKEHPAIGTAIKQFDRYIAGCKLLGIGISQEEIEDEIGDFFSDDQGGE